MAGNLFLFGVLAMFAIFMAGLAYGQWNARGITAPGSI